jgi:hypothetical protein
MITTHKISNWGGCLSNVIMPAIKKGFKDVQTNEHFFWGLGSDNISKIHQIDKRTDMNWWMTDVGYLTQNIQRYPEPDIIDIDKTYFRICKRNVHNDLSNVSDDPTRFEALQSQDIWYAVEFDNYEPKPIDRKKYILLTPSSPTVCVFANGVTQDKWISIASDAIRKHTWNEIYLRNKPRPGNKWWDTKVQDNLKEASVLVTNLSLCAIDAVIAGVPIICDPRNICASLGTQDFSKINEIEPVSKEDLYTWMCKAANCQFTLEEIENGMAKEYLSL